MKMTVTSERRSIDEFESKLISYNEGMISDLNGPSSAFLTYVEYKGRQMIRCDGVLIDVAKYSVEVVDNVAQVYLSRSQKQHDQLPVRSP